MKNQESYFRQYAVYALFHLEDPKAREKLDSMIEDQNERIDIRQLILLKFGETLDDKIKLKVLLDSLKIKKQMIIKQELMENPQHPIINSLENSSDLITQYLDIMNRKDVVDNIYYYLSDGRFEDDATELFLNRTIKQLDNVDPAKSLLFKEFGNVVVADIGSYFSLIGYIEESKPDIVIRSVIGVPKYSEWHSDIDLDTNKFNFLVDNIFFTIGLAGVTRFVAFSSRYSMNNSLLQIFWDHIRIKLRKNMTKKTLIFSYSPFIQSDIKKDIEEVLKKFFNLIFMIPSPILVLNAVDKKTGLIVDSGEEYTTVYPVYEGKIISEAMKQTKVGGRLIENYLTSLLKKRGYKFKTSVFRDETIREIKETFCYVNCKGQESDDKEEIYITLEGECTIIRDEKHLATEILFNPSLLDKIKLDSIPTVILDSVDHCPDDIKDELLNNIILCGGNTLFRGFPERLEQEMTKLFPDGTQYRIIAPENRQLLAWMGGSNISKKNVDFFKKYKTDSVD